MVVVAWVGGESKWTRMGRFVISGGKWVTARAPRKFRGGSEMNDGMRR